MTVHCKTLTRCCFVALVLAVCALSLAASCSCMAHAPVARSVIRVGSALEFPPYSFVDDKGQPAGFSVDLIKAVAKAMGLSIKFSTSTWDTVWNNLVTGQIDVLPVVAKMPERLALVDFGLPHTRTYDAFFVRKGHPLIADIAAAQGKEIVVVRSDAAHQALLERNFRGVLILVDTIPEGLSLISAGKHDAFLCSKLIGTLEIRKHKIEDLDAGPPIPDYRRIFSFAVKKGDSSLLERLNQGLLIIKTNGQYDRIYEKWLTGDDPWRNLKKYYLPAVAGAIAITLAMALWLAILGRQVERRTEELESVNAALRLEISRREQMRDGLRKSEERFFKIFHAAPLTTTFTCLADGRFVEVNDAFLDLFGYTLDEIIGRKSLELNEWVNAADREKIVEILKERGRVKDFETRFRVKSGKIIDALVSAEVIDMEGQQYILSVIQDITERKQAEEALIKSESLLNHTQHLAKMGCWEYDVANQRVFWTQETYRIHEVFADYVPDINTAIEFYAPHDRARIERAFWLAAEKGVPYDLELELNSASGVHKWVRTMAQVELAEGKTKRVFGNIMDITVRKRIEDAIINAKREWEGTFDAISDWVCIMDKDHTIVRSNRSLDKFCNCTVDEIINKRFCEVLHGVKEPFPDCPVERALKSGAREEMEFQVEEGRWLHVTVDPIKSSHNAELFVHIVKDITRRKTAEKSLRESEERFRTIFELAAVGVAQVDSRSGRFVRVNKKLCDILGYSIEEMMGLCFQDITHHDHIHADVGKVARLLAGDIATFSIEKRYIHKNGSTVWATWTVSPLRAEGLKPDFHISIVQDITERKLAEAARARLEAENRQLQKAESLGRMAGSIAHHFNNKLSTVMGNLELALYDLPKESEVRESILESLNASRQAAEVSQMMLAYLGQTIGRNEPLDLVETIQGSLRFSSASTGSHVHLKTDYPPMRPVILGNNGHIKQILTNLLSNAVEAIDQNNGDITVAIRVTQRAEIEGLPFFPIAWEPKAEQYVCLSVSDTGCGMDSTTQEKIFDPFFSTKFTGRGLGLPVVMGLVRAHDGAATVASSPGRGTTFKVFFPLHTIEPVPPMKDEPLASGPFEKGGFILLVDDDPGVRKMATAMLKRMDYEVLAASSGAEALKLFKENPDRVRFVITDLTMEGMNGWEILAALRKIRPDIPAVLASGHDEPYAMGIGHADLPHVFLHKPYSKTELDSAIDKLCRQAVSK